MNQLPRIDYRESTAVKIEWTMPDWAIKEIRGLPDAIVDVPNRMREVVRFSRLNFENGTGGPFAAGVFERTSGKVVALGVNRVVPSSSSSAHAEIMALSLAQQRLKSFDLSAPGMPDHQLVVNARPCAMCFGSIPWSGIRSLVVAASGEQVEAITGFDEGPLHPEWRQQLIKRGIEVIENILNVEAVAVLKDFATSGQCVYNAQTARYML